jgi:hypothetical protein
MTSPDYDTDFYAWTQAQAEALRAKESKTLDWDNLAEEIESLGRSQRKAVRSHLRNLLMHLLKWTYQPDQRPQLGGSWRTSIRNARREIRDELYDSPSLRSLPGTLLSEVYSEAREDAADETGLPIQTFPNICRWSVEEVLFPDFWPDEPPQEVRSPRTGPRLIGPRRRPRC